MIKETFSATDWEEHFDLYVNFCVLNWDQKTLLLHYKSINLSFWAIFNLAAHLRWSENSLVDLASFKKNLRQWLIASRDIDDQRSFNLTGWDLIFAYNFKLGVSNWERNSFVYLEIK